MNKIRLALACAMHAFLLIGMFLIVVLSANFGPLSFLTTSGPLHAQNEVPVGLLLFFDNVAFWCLEIRTGAIDLIPL